MKTQTETKPNGADQARPPLSAADKATLDEYERLESATIIDEDDAEVEGSDEPSVIDVEDRIPKWTPFRVNPDTSFVLWGVIHQAQMDKTIITTTKEFAPELEAQEVDLRPVRFWETVTADGVVRLVYSFTPEKGARKPNTWLASKREVMNAARTDWITMASRRKLGKFTYRKCRRDHGEPKFSGYTIGQLIEYGLRRQGLLVENEEHDFYKLVAEIDD
jgi:hypothetical protein